ILQNYVDEVDPKVLYEGAMRGLLDSLQDPHSTFLDAEAMRDMQDTTVGQYGGIGLYISKTPPASRLPGEEPWVEVVSPIEGTPGWRAGIQPGDWISEIDGVSTAPLTMSEVLKRLRGAPGSTVVLTIRRGDLITFPLAIVRALIEVPSVKSAMLPNRAGYLRIIEFNPQTASRVQAAVEDFRYRGATAMVLDLRNNPGGLLSAAIDTADLFLQSGVIVSTRSRTPMENQVFRARPPVPVPTGWPVIVLLNRGSASASEILAGALRDQGRAYLIGERSYGKGAVQQVFPLGETGFKLTMSRYFTPSDADIDKVGIAPDLEIREPELADEESAELSRILEQRLIANFAREKPNATEEERRAFVRGLLGSGVRLPERLLNRLVRDEVQRTSIAPAFDLDYDIQLQEAVRILDGGRLPELLSISRAMRESQRPAAAP
ncbi:MAG TPA: S41 family peptidase, partial [Magnetospirillaceae bacterium]|nr:S41 family peptidase [Magnetospirillaceae bacterium]